jgi:hypothetical protein
VKLSKKIGVHLEECDILTRYGSFLRPESNDDTLHVPLGTPEFLDPAAHAGSFYFFRAGLFFVTSKQPGCKGIRKTLIFSGPANGTGPFFKQEISERFTFKGHK